VSQRIQKVNELIKRELSQILLREADFPKDILVTLTRVDTAPNLSQSKIYISVFPVGQIEGIIKFLNRRVYEFQQRLNKRLRMRPMPKIIFVREKKTAEAGRIEEILEEAKKQENH